MSLEQGIQFTEEDLYHACCSDNSSVIELLLDSGVKPTEKAFHALTMSPNPQKSKSLVSMLEHGLTPTPELMNTCCVRDCLDTAKFLVSEGLQPTRKDFKLSSTIGAAHVVRWMIEEQGAKPSVSLYKDVCSMNFSGKNNKVLNILIEPKYYWRLI
tara:strand:+ start:93791 stop:94258 length:468 start_codon:yes stop_codon:yes gene_type:complete